MKKTAFTLACILLLGMTAPLHATPSKVFITRHGNKVENGYCLSLQGIERAEAFVPYFTQTKTYVSPPISHIIAAFAEYKGGHKPYIRPKQTCQPLADYLHLSLDLRFIPGEVATVAEELLTNPKYDGSSVLLCWEHHHIPALVEALGGEKPKCWPDDIFDQVYVITYEEGKKPVVKKVLQKLLYGDRSTVDSKPTPLPEIPAPCPKSY